MHRTTSARTPRIVASLALVTALAATTLAASAVRAAAAGQDATWIGEVEKHGRHYDYVGRPCPIDSDEVCPDYIVRYEIVPTSAQAARALPKVAGHRARLIGHRELVRQPGHNGTLMVSEVQSKRAPDDPVPAPQ